jgi:hypothetical protein
LRIVERAVGVEQLVEQSDSERADFVSCSENEGGTNAPSSRLGRVTFVR